jgi:hypothetical protein
MAHKYSQSVVIEQFITKHTDKFDYSKVDYKGDSIPVVIKCLKHDNIFSISPEFHKVRESGGCKKCSIEIRRLKSNVISYCDIIKKFIKKHGDKYDYRYVKDTYENNHSRIKIICPLHGMFDTTVQVHTKNGCSKCGDIKRLSKVSLDNNKFVSKSKIIHKEYYDYSKVKYINIHTKVIIICPKHGEFHQHPGSHFRGSGCPKCKISHGEKLLESFFIEKGIKYISQHRFKDCVYKRPLPFDFYLPEYNICVEYHGEQHYKPVERFGGSKYYELTKLRDEIKHKYCLENNIKLIIINNKNKRNLEQFFTEDEKNSC